jgi:hypothetical protein
MTTKDRAGMYAKLGPRDAVAHALTAYDRRMSRSKHHNPYFIAHALRALNDAHGDNPGADLLGLIEPFSGRLLGFLIRELGLSDVAQVGRRGDLEMV